ncbi:MAG: zf-HC2 domain-containing protein [Oscillospiraceae bacterium]|nr:zf-HC2 domain-containing protein [Oscillospiraceae bacterium]
MKTDCDVIRDLLPLYADDACSKKSRELVEEHLQECPTCSDLLHKLQETEIEDDLRNEKNAVIQYGAQRFKRRSAAVGSAVSGSFMIPILVCLYLSFVFGTSLSWVFIVLAALCVAASLIAVPLMVQEDKLFWTFCAFCVSLIFLLGVICLCTHGNWFWIASSATLFGLAVIFLPFLVKARPVQKFIGNTNKLLLVLGLDAALFVNMMTTITSYGRISRRMLLSRGIIVVLILIAIDYFRKRGTKK